MLYAKVVFGLPVDGPFDYHIPSYLEKKVMPGIRVIVPFRDRKLTGYVVDVSHKTNIKNLKQLYDIVDAIPLLNQEMLALSKEISLYYFCSWGEAIETMLPEGLRGQKKISIRQGPDNGLNPKRNQREALLIQDLTNEERWQTYWQEIEETLREQEDIIFLSPVIEQAAEIKNLIQARIRQEVALLHSRQGSKENLVEWLKIKNNEVRIVVGSRQAVFAPVNNLGLIILDNENDSSYKQEQVPHYHARDVAIMRSRLNGARIIMSAIAPSLESIYLARRDEIKFEFIDKKNFPQVNIVDMRREFFDSKKKVFSYPLLDMLNFALQYKRKTLIFLNKKGFASSAYCRKCHTPLKCQRCNINLVYHYRESRLVCHYCNYSAEPPKICPECNSSYIRYAGIGTEKIESELARFYPQAKILNAEELKEPDSAEADILVSTRSVFKHKLKYIEFIGVISLDNSLNRIDFRAPEKTFFMLLSLISLDAKRLVIQTRLPWHYCFKSILNKDYGSFYENELKTRRQLGLPPFKHIILIKLRGISRERVKERAQFLFEKLKKINKEKSVEIISCFASTPPKLRGNYHWQILIKSKTVERSRHFFKKNLKDFKTSGIITTVNVDPL